MNIVKIPNEITSDIAYLSGLIFGDGHLCVRKDKHEYSIHITGNLRDESEFYKTVIAPMFKTIFLIDPKIRINDKNSTITIVIYSKELLFYFSNTFDIPIGKKSHLVCVPKIIKNKNFKKEFIQGFADADFSLCLKRLRRKQPYYPVINGTSKSKKIILQIADFLKNNEIPFSLQLDRSQYDKRTGKYNVVSCIYISGINNVMSWNNIIGFRNSKYLNIIKKLGNSG